MRGKRALLAAVAFVLLFAVGAGAALSPTLLSTLQLTASSPDKTGSFDNNQKLYNQQVYDALTALDARVSKLETASTSATTTTTTTATTTTATTTTTPTTTTTTTTASGEPIPISGQGYHEAFRDDFNGTSLDSTAWTPKEFWESDPPAGAVVVSDGTVKINNDRSCCDDQSITTGPYWSGDPIKKSWTYGYFEARMKFTDAQGSWPAFWLESVANANSALCPTLNFELDIMEYQGDEPNTFYGSEHRNTNGGCGVGDSTRPNLYPQPGKLAGDWHTFAVLWTASTITWYVDGVTMESGSTFDSGNQPMYIALTMQACGWDSTNACTASTPNPLTTEVDYVTVWQK